MSIISYKPIRPKRSQTIYSIVSMGLLLLLPAVFGVVVWEANSLMALYKENIAVLVELKNGTNTAARQRLEGWLQAHPYVKGETVRFVSKEAGLVFMQEYLGTEVVADAELGNPLLDALEFNVKNEYVDTLKMNELRAKIAEDSVVEQVTYNEVVVDNLGGNLRRMMFIFGGIGLFFLVLVVALINNTVRIALFANRFLIKNMQLVGATARFIIQPFVIIGIKNGFRGGLLACFGAWGFMYWFYNNISLVRSLKEQFFLGVVVSIFILILGMAVAGLSTWLSIRGYLRKKLDELY